MSSLAQTYATALNVRQIPPIPAIDRLQSAVYPSVMNTQVKLSEDNYWWRKKRGQEPCTDNLKPGSICPVCREGLLSYDGLFILGCRQCGFVATTGAFT